MSNESFRIPKHGGAESAFLGVEFKDTYILIVSVFVALFAGKAWGTGAYLGIPFVGYHVNRKYLEWRNTRLPGFFHAFLFSWSLAKYSKGFKTQCMVYVGDATIINPGTKRLLAKIHHRVE